MSFNCKIVRVACGGLFALAVEANSSDVAFAASGTEVTVDEVWSIAASHSPALQRAGAAGAVIAAEGLTAAALLDPSLEGKAEWPTGSHAPETKNEYEVSVAQPLRLGDLTGERGKLGRITQTFSEQQAHQERLKVFFEVEELFAEIAALEGLKPGLLKSGARARQVLNRLHHGSALLSLQGSERALIEAEGEALIGAEIALLGEISERRAALERLIGAPLPDGALQQPKLGEPLEPRAFVAAVRDSPEGLARRLTVQAERAERRLALTRVERGGVLSPRVVYRRSDDGTDFLGFALEVPLPVWGASRGEQVVHESERAAALTEQRFVESPAFERYLTALVVGYGERRRHADVVQKKIIPALVRAADAGAKELQAGQISVAQFIALVRDLHERSREGVEAYLTALRIGTELRLLQGDGV